MTKKEALELLEKTDEAQVLVTFVVEVDDVEFQLKRLTELGYSRFLRHTAIGNEIVVTDKVIDLQPSNLTNL